MISAEHFRHAAARGGSISVSDLVGLHGRATWPALLLVMAVLCTLPMAGIGTALSLPMLALATRWPSSVTKHRNRAGAALPRRLLDVRLGQTWSHRCLRLFASLYEKARMFLRRRWAGWRHPRTFAGWRVWIAVMALLILLPLPFGNLLPGVSLVLLGLGWIYKDGLALMLSLLAGAAALCYCAVSARALWAVVEASAAWWTRTGS